VTDRRDVRTEAVIQRSRDLQAQLSRLASELETYVHDLEVEVERWHDSKERPDA
jgi:hypothetical protein